MAGPENKRIIEEAVAAWQAGDGAAFFRRLADDARWTVIGSTPVSRTFTGRRQFIEEALKPISAKLRGGIRMEVVNVIAEGDHVVLQWDGTAETVSGEPYRNRYCWVMRLRAGKIVEGTAYLDTERVSRLLG